MTQSELEQLPIDKQRNVMLTIAIGRDAKDYYHEYVNGSLILTEPQNDGALMWKLVCELARTESIGNLQVWNLCSYIRENEANIESCVILAYISADPKGNIAKWRSEQQKSDTITSDNLEIDARTSNNL